MSDSPKKPAHCAKAEAVIHSAIKWALGKYKNQREACNRLWPKTAYETEFSDWAYDTVARYQAALAVTDDENEDIRVYAAEAAGWYYSRPYYKEAYDHVEQEKGWVADPRTHPRYKISLWTAAENVKWAKQKAERDIYEAEAAAQIANRKQEMANLSKQILAIYEAQAIRKTVPGTPAPADEPDVKALVRYRQEYGPSYPDTPSYYE